MSTNMTLIEAKTSSSTSVTFTNIPQAYTDLKLFVSSRDNDNSNQWTRFDIELNGDTTSGNYRTKYGYSLGSGTGSATGTEVLGYSNSSGTTANSFSNCEIYIPSYSATIEKSWTWNSVTGNMVTNQLDVYGLGDWTGTAAITQIKIKSPNTFLAGSTFYLYGISNVTSTTKATGGIVSSDGTYNYHTFPYSGTFTPTQNITADYLVIAGGGGGGGGYRSGGGGAGGLRSTVTATGGGGSLESALSLTANTAYTVTVGAGGSGITNSNGTSGGNSVFGSITATGGGYGGGNWDSGNAGGAGGSGGGGIGSSSTGGAGGTRTASPVQGFNGGSGYSGGLQCGGGGGGAGAIGQNGGSGGTDGDGGNGVQITTLANATQTGVTNGYYAGGGGGGNYGSGNVTIAGLGGAGAGGSGDSPYKDGVSAIVNTGSGGGGASGDGYKGGNGGSGLVIIRYAI